MPKKSTQPTKEQIKSLEKTLKYKPRLVWDHLKAAEQEKVETTAEEYKAFLDAGKTEREAADRIAQTARDKGFEMVGQAKKKARLMNVNLDRVVFLAVPGKKPAAEGVRLIISHLDSPRLDFKPRPLYEEADLALFKTHYYGGLKKYQWLSRPLALHGRVVKSDGSVVDLVIGEDADDPVFTVADLLPHLSRKTQSNKKVSEAFPGEKLNLLAGSRPLGDSEVSDRFKLAVLNLLHEKYGLIEEDFISAEFEAVPAGVARDVGLDRGLIGAYGHDDRICAFTSMKALFGLEKPERTCVAVFVDKEEIGSDGATGAKSRFLENFIADLLENQGVTPSAAAIRRTLINTAAISGDVNGALDPDYPDVHEKNNAARLGYGPCLTKYTGGGGKYGASEAPASLVGWLRGVFQKRDVIWQTGLLGKIDEGGGGTVAMYLAEHGMSIVDMGPALLAMHSPFEVASKADLYMTIKAYGAFYEAPSE